MRAASISALAALAIAVEGSSNAHHDRHCGSLLRVFPPGGPVQVHTARSVSAGGLSLSSEDSTEPIQNEFAICHVQGTIKYADGPSGHVQPDPSGSATLTWEVFLPEHAEYNGRYLGVGEHSSPIDRQSTDQTGNGGYAGVIDNYTMLTYLNSGYAVGGCDSGHHVRENGNEDGYAPFMDDVAKVKAWIHDSIALTTRVARDAVTTAYYSHPPAYSYYYGCSTGGGQGYSLAEFYPDLFDGIYASGPGNYYSHLILSFLWNTQKTNTTGFMTQDLLTFITEAALDNCDALDGVKDRVIENPFNCLFDVQELECTPESDHNATLCLTTPQVAAARQIYSGAFDARNGFQVYPGFEFGSEVGWLEQQGTLFNTYGAPILRQLAFDDPSYDAVRNFHWRDDLHAVDALASPLIDGISTNLTEFHGRGGKFITAQGWADPINAAKWPVNHLQDIQAVMGEGVVNEFMRLFMVPGGGHCGTNPAYPQVPATYHILDALVEWVENETVPDDGVLSSEPPDGSGTTRRLCPWPKQAVLVGDDQNDWGSYECAEVS
ncbi:tannase and feruloyl esterase-domain-containing protein [Aspergillus lucknowensis]|uniref:Carboxylic ester hydrolase n=1 Tax=Aspergillus lucknowensis TaxID=176173 RepID=A0ABR4LIQ3_9EURO